MWGWSCSTHSGGALQPLKTLAAACGAAISARQCQCRLLCAAGHSGKSRKPSREASPLRSTSLSTGSSSAYPRRRRARHALTTPYVPSLTLTHPYTPLSLTHTHTHTPNVLSPTTPPRHSRAPPYRRSRCARRARCARRTTRSRTPPCSSAISTSSRRTCASTGKCSAFTSSRCAPPRRHHTPPCHRHAPPTAACPSAVICCHAPPHALCPPHFLPLTKLEGG